MQTYVLNYVAGGAATQTKIAGGAATIVVVEWRFLLGFFLLLIVGGPTRDGSVSHPRGYPDQLTRLCTCH